MTVKDKYVCVASKSLNNSVVTLLYRSGITVVTVVIELGNLNEMGVIGSKGDKGQ